MKLSWKLSHKHFYISQILILTVGLTFLFGLYYILNVQYQPKSKTPFSNGPLTTPFKSLRLDLDHPGDDSLIFKDSILVSGRTNPVSNVLVFTDSQNMVIKSKPDGSFSTTLSLDEGVNRITVAVFDTTGDSKEVQRIVYYSEEEI